MSDWILVTGGTGYIGSHTCVELMQAGREVCIVNSRASVAARIGRLAGRGVELQTGDVRDRAFLDRVFSGRRYGAVIHFAGLKAVGESVSMPLKYHDVNVVDLARAHVSALAALPRLPGATPVNLGTGRGHSVLEVVAAFERASGRPIPYRIEPRRPGDVAASYTDPSLALRLLGWRAERGLDDMCRDAWRWQQWSAAHASEL